MGHPGTASKGISEAIALRQFKVGHDIQRDRFTVLLRTVELADIGVRHPASMAQTACEPALVQRGSPLTVRCDALNPRFQQDAVGCRLASGPTAWGAPAALRSSRPERKRRRLQLDSASTASKLAEPSP